jgi:AGZA family xanthine/uracil permease-like MFS transporter
MRCIILQRFLNRSALLREEKSNQRKEQPLIERYFKLAAHQTTVKQEMLGGLTTFVTMAYIIVVNPQILAQAGMPAEGVLFATCISAATPPP